MEIPTASATAAVRSVETHDVKTLILDPDPAQEPALAGFRQGTDVEHEAADFAEKFAPNIVEFVVLAIEAICIDKNHLQETVGQILHGEGKKVTDRRNELLAGAAGIRNGNEVDAL